MLKIKRNKNIYRFDKQPARRRVPKAVKRTMISVPVLLVLLVGGGIGYTYMMGQRGPEVALAEAPKVVTAPVVKPVPPAPNAKVGVAVQSLTSPSQPGSNASITIRSIATSKCTISVVYNNVASTDSGLSPKAADAYGMVTWTWTIDKTVPLGKWPVKVTCEFNGRSAVVQTDLVVAKQP